MTYSMEPKGNVRIGTAVDLIIGAYNPALSAASIISSPKASNRITTRLTAFVATVDPIISLSFCSACNNSPDSFTDCVHWVTERVRKCSGKCPLLLNERRLPTIIRGFQGCRQRTCRCNCYGPTHRSNFSLFGLAAVPIDQRA